MITIDCHVHIGKDTQTEYQLTVEELQRMMYIHRVDYAVVFPCPWDNNENPYVRRNEAVVKAAVQFTNLIPVLMVAPSFVTTVKAIEDLVTKSTKVRALKFYPPAQAYGPQSIMNSRIWKLALSHKLPLIFHTSLVPEETVGVIDIAKEYPYPVIAAHAFRLHKELLKHSSALSNLYLDVAPMNTLIALAHCSNSPVVSGTMMPIELQKTLLTPETVVTYLFELMQGRVIWGSDLPWSSNLANAEGEYRYLERLDLAIVERMMENAAMIFLH